mmetsp:Transcript_46614/g.120705  ORF Transcript_46614/g.120705 Transcript_46614/m.120705 type:complete len:468 (+) Transcript_46614:128-1531(+)
MPQWHKMDGRKRGCASRCSLGAVVARADVLGDGGQLNVAGPLVDGADLGVSIVLLCEELLGEAHASQPVDALRRDTLGHLRGLQLRHGGFLDEGLAGFLEAGCIVDQHARSLNLHGGPRVLELHALEVGHGLAELLSRAHVGERVVKGSQCKANHLRGNADAAFVEQGDGHLVALPHLTQHSAVRHAAALEVELACGGGANAELVLLFANLQTRVVLLHNERCDALVPLLPVRVRKDHEDSGLQGVGDPALAAVEHPVAAVTHGSGLQCEGVGAGAGLGEAEAGHRVSGKPSEVLFLLLRGAIGVERGDEQGVLDVHEHGDCRVHLGDLLHSEARGGEVQPGAAVLLGSLNAHEAVLEEGVDDLLVHLPGLVLRHHAGQQHLLRKLPGGVTQHLLILRQRRCGCDHRGRCSPGTGTMKLLQCRKGTDPLGQRGTSHRAAGNRSAGSGADSGRKATLCARGSRQQAAA